MRHSFIDKYSDRNSLLHRLDPRAKIAAAVLFIVCIVTTPCTAWPQFAGYAFLAALSAAFSKVPLFYIAARSALSLPFVMIVALSVPFTLAQDPLPFYGALITKAWLSSLVIVLLSSTTPFPLMVKGLEKLGVPKIMTVLLSFMYRYVFVLIDEVERMHASWKARYFGRLHGGLLKTFGHIAGSLFIRTYERSERVFYSMAARGFDGEMRVLHVRAFTALDVLCVAAVAAYVAGVKVLL